MRIHVETLAIKLYEHDPGSTGEYWPERCRGWLKLSNARREKYRSMARVVASGGNPFDDGDD